MRDMVAEARADHKDHADNCDESRRPKTVREKMGDTITDRLILRYCSTCDEELHQLYQEWDARPRGVSERWVHQQAVEASCAVFNVPAFEVTPAHVMALKISPGRFYLLRHRFGHPSFQYYSGRCYTPSPKPGPCWSQIESEPTILTWGGTPRVELLAQAR
jgi:hypothetical protein